MLQRHKGHLLLYDIRKSPDISRRHAQNRPRQRSPHMLPADRNTADKFPELEVYAYCNLHGLWKC